jgi:DNA-binding NarL/FixJ family response regulator
MGVRILIADDSELTRRMLRSLLQANSEWQVCGEAENGSVAVQVAIELRPDVIILDLTMPEVSGLGAARLISAALPNTPIILHTMHAVPGLEVEATKNGVTKVLPKSEGANLVSVIQELLSQRRSHFHGLSPQTSSVVPVVVPARIAPDPSQETSNIEDVQGSSTQPNTNIGDSLKKVG